MKIITISIVILVVVSAKEPTSKETYDDYEDNCKGLSCSRVQSRNEDCISALPDATDLILTLPYQSHCAKSLSIGDLQTYIDQSIRQFRTGQIFAFATDKRDPYLLPCDGASYYKADYPDLYDALKYTIGTEEEGDDPLKFRVPNLGPTPYLRAASRSSVGEKTMQSIQSHSHTSEPIVGQMDNIASFGRELRTSGAFSATHLNNNPPSPKSWASNLGDNDMTIVKFQATPRINSAGSSETRPNSYGVYYAIHI
ncbi:uncharacterized protein LOC136041958 [Artemia franciscana]|uniref:Phage tail collar domain-containing protein n=1 Tax=Artemia franciscana TaxID=6661 RepID=A0AA88HDI5_ARTSF|nr:hypothetical protein QYM36_018225 [Artemia franciscana]